MDKLTLIPIGGLANRIYAITSAIAYCSGTLYSIKNSVVQGLGNGEPIFILYSSFHLQSKVEIKDGKWYDYLMLDNQRRKTSGFLFSGK